MKPYMLSKFGMALVAASAVAAPLPSAWRVEAGAPLSMPRAAHQATLLDADLVLLTGGCSGASCTPVERSAELVDGRTGQLAATASMQVARVGHGVSYARFNNVKVGVGYAE